MNQNSTNRWNKKKFSTQARMNLVCSLCVSYKSLLMLLMNLNDFSFFLWLNPFWMIICIVWGYFVCLSFRLLASPQSKQKTSRPTRGGISLREALPGYLLSSLNYFISKLFVHNQIMFICFSLQILVRWVATTRGIQLQLQIQFQLVSSTQTFRLRKFSQFKAKCHHNRTI